MQKKIFVFLISVICLGSLSAQTFNVRSSLYKNTVPDVKKSPDSLRILAVMVDFQVEKPEDAATVGNGKFGTMYSTNYGTRILDPLPHDKNYFALHLEFAKNYFRTVSNGKLNISYNVLPDTFTVSKKMRDYSPAGNSQDLSPLSAFASEVWTKVKAAYPGINFSSYDVFTIFHAGVGRDVTLPGSFGNERDLPSVYLGDAQIRSTLTDLSGMPLNREGKYNSMIVPETESREIKDITDAVNLLQISINGLIAANIGSHIGLPDLFDTKTGLSAIGRFGLMDGQAIFTYSGLFPPEPSPWEKIRLGWAEPVVLNNTENRPVNLTALRAAGLSDTVIVKIPINSSEYYLVENRARDAQKNGAVVTYVTGTDTLTKVFPRDTTGFYYYSADSISGVVIKVDEYDWAVPGNGIVIWHIDDKVINEKIASNQINTDKFRRGVDVEEADGVQDIGEKFLTVFGDEVIGEGTDQDFWYKSNPAKLYKNRFSWDTQPSALTNTGASSLITMSGFSDIANRMTFSLSFGDSLLKPLASAKISSNGIIKNLTVPTGAGSRFAVSGRTLLRFDNKGNITDSVSGFSIFKPAAVTINNTEYVVGADSNKLNVYMNNGTAKFTGSQTIAEKITAVPVITANAGGQAQILVGTEKGRILFFTPGELPSANPVLIKEESLSQPGEAIVSIAADGISYSVVYRTMGLDNRPVYRVSDPLRKEFTIAFPVRKLVLTKDRNGNYVDVVLSENNLFSVVSGESLLKQIDLGGTDTVSSFSVGDIRQDGENYIVFSHGKYIEARNLQGASADNFPVKDPLDSVFTATPLLYAAQGSNYTEVVAATRDGRVMGINGTTGKIISGFPVSSGARLSGNPVLFNFAGKIALALVTATNYFYSWTIDRSEGTLYWADENGSNTNTSFAGQAAYTNRQTAFMPKERAYNWPNPVYGGQTNIRYFVSEDAKINIRIFDLAGDLVAELSDNARGGFDNETVWNVGSVQSGVYYARIEATGVTGKSENSTIKIAVIK